MSPESSDIPLLVKARNKCSPLRDRLEVTPDQTPRAIEPCYAYVCERSLIKESWEDPLQGMPILAHVSFRLVCDAIFRGNSGRLLSNGSTNITNEHSRRFALFTVFGRSQTRRKETNFLG